MSFLSINPQTVGTPVTFQYGSSGKSQISGAKIGSFRRSVQVFRRHPETVAFNAYPEMFALSAIPPILVNDVKNSLVSSQNMPAFSDIATSALFILRGFRRKHIVPSGKTVYSKMMNRDEWEFFEEQIAVRVLTEAAGLSAAISDLCRLNPRHGADSLLLGAVSVATNLDRNTNLFEDNSAEVLIDRYRVIAVLAADIAVLATGRRTCGDLQMFWLSSDSEVFTPHAT
tara:strand:- start:1190 stop:1873 length:684 start_codon:yes stop_codon:yes gene_type:complete